MKPVKAFFVGDHTDGPNWGGRSQSLALASLLRRRFVISGSVPGGVVTGSGPFVNTLLPSTLADAIFYRRDRAAWVERLARLQELLGARDVVTGDPAESAESILKFSGRFEALGTLRRQVEEADVVVLNGEGSGIFGTPYRRDFFFYLALAEVGLRLGKPVFFVNTIFSDSPRTGRNTESLAAAEAVLSRCTDVHVRDPYSLEYAAETMPKVRCRYVPDALFTWVDRVQDPGFQPPAVGDFAIPYPEVDWRWFGRLDFSRPYVCLGGSSRAAEEPERAQVAFHGLVEEMKSLDVPVYVVETCRGDAFLRRVVAETGVGFVPRECPIMIATAILTHARLLVSGRFHPTILASLGGTPCVFMEAHSHKMRSLQESLGYENEPMFSTFPDEAEVGRIVARSREIVCEGEKDDRIRGRVLEAARARAAEAGETADILWAKLS
jgi:Polysaccharide pyruvyl transferase